MQLPDARRQIGLIGPSRCSEHERRLAFAIGGEVARRGHLLVCGGGSGVMAAGCAGARQRQGTTIGILPGTGTHDSPANTDLDIVIYTGMGQARNQLIVLSSAAVIAVGGEWGTLSEIALAQKYGVPAVLVDSWRLEAPNERLDDRIERCSDAAAAVDRALALAAARSQPTRQEGAAP